MVGCGRSVPALSAVPRLFFQLADKCMLQLVHDDGFMQSCVRAVSGLAAEWQALMYHFALGLLSGRSAMFKGV